MPRNEYQTCDLNTLIIFEVKKQTTRCYLFFFHLKISYTREAYEFYTKPVCLFYYLFECAILFFLWLEFANIISIEPFIIIRRATLVC